jgi:hypothetical protein
MVNAFWGRVCSARCGCDCGSEWIYGGESEFALTLKLRHAEVLFYLSTARIFHCIIVWYNQGMERNPRVVAHQPKRVATSIKIQPELAEYLEWLSETLQRDRTFLINAIVSEHAYRHRNKMPPPLKIIPM